MVAKFLLLFLFGLNNAFHIPFTMRFTLPFVDSVPSFTSFPLLSKLTPPWAETPEARDYDETAMGSELPSFQEPVYNNIPSFGKFSMPNTNWLTPPYISAKDVKSENKTYDKDGFHVTEVKNSGPGWSSYVSEARKEVSNKTGNASLGDFGKNLFELYSGSSPLKVFSRNKKCVKCPKTRFCDPSSGKCRRQLKPGSVCMLKNQCEAPLMCVWGRCNVATSGDIGTFCINAGSCHGDARCIQYTDYHRVCVPALQEGSICETQSEDCDLKMFFGCRAKVPTKENPCKRGLKCADVGDNLDKRCVAESFKETTDAEDRLAKIAEQKQEEQKSGESDDDDGSSDQNDSKYNNTLPTPQPDRSDQNPFEPDETSIESPKSKPRRKRKNKKVSHEKSSR